MVMMIVVVSILPATSQGLNCSPCEPSPFIIFSGVHNLFTAFPVMPYHHIWFGIVILAFHRSRVSNSRSCNQNCCYSEKKWFHGESVCKCILAIKKRGVNWIWPVSPPSATTIFSFIYGVVKKTSVAGGALG
jgi:hypothetical protein